MATRNYSEERMEIGKLGQELFVRISDMAEHAEDMGKSLKRQSNTTTA